MALTDLRENWCLMRDGSRWVVGEVRDDCFECSESITRLGTGRTVAAAIRAAVAEVERREQEAAERRADYERRKAAGELTEWEKWAEQGMEIWAPKALEMIQRQSPLFAALVNRGFEDVPTMGDTIRVNSHEYKAVR
jgi:hypothetical protein